MSKLINLASVDPKDAVANWLQSFADILHAPVELGHARRKELRRAYRRAKAILTAVLMGRDGQRIVTPAGVVSLAVDTFSMTHYPTWTPHERRADYEAAAA
jgi:hypothetical protein